MKRQRITVGLLLGTLVLALVASLSGFSAAGASAPPDGSSVHLGTGTISGHGGTKLVPVYLDAADETSGADPDFWAYCIEHDVPLAVDRPGVVGDWASFLGSNYFDSDPAVAGKVAWILVNSYPARTLAELSAASGVAGLTTADAVEATQYAIWRYTDLTFDATWPFDNERVEDLYFWLLAGAGPGGYTEADLAAMAESVSLAATSTPQVAGTLVGPVTVTTSATSAVVSVDPAVAVVDVDGDPVDLSAVPDGTDLYLDLRGSTAAGSVDVTATVPSSAGTGMVVSVDQGQSQTLMLVGAADAMSTATAALAWSGVAGATPSIGTTVAVVGSSVKELALSGGTVIDTVAYDGLTPGTEYVLTGSIRMAPGGADTGISATRTFTPTAATGTVDVTFTLTAEQAAAHAGADLVVFEYLTLAGAPVAEHADPTDADQTFSVEEASTTSSSSSSTSSSTSTPGGTATAVPGTPGSLPRTGTTPGELAALAAMTVVSGITLLGLRARLRGSAR